MLLILGNKDKRLFFVGVYIAIASYFLLKNRSRKIIL